MKQTFDYIKTVTALDSFTVEDVGNASIQAFNDIGEEYYLVVRSSVGYCTITTFGPIEDRCPNSSQFFYSSYTIQYNEKKLCTIIDKFINDTKKNITQLLEIELEDVVLLLKEVLLKCSL